MQAPILAQKDLTAAQWNMKLLRSWQYILLAVGMVLILPLEIAFLQAGIHYLGFVPFGVRFLGWLMIHSAIASILMVPCALLAPINRSVANVVVHIAWILLEVKKYMWYGILAMSFVAWFLTMTSNKGFTGDQLNAFSVIGHPPVVAFVMLYVIALYNTTINVSFAAKALNTDRFDHAFGHSSGLNWQSFILAGLTLLIALLFWPLSWILENFIPGMIFVADNAMPDYDAIIATYNMVKQMVAPFVVLLKNYAFWVALGTVKFVGIALTYIKFMRVTEQMKGSAVDTVVANTAEGASPIPSDLRR